ncbi:CDP-glycerol glycerophosphotransferase family protein [Brochothrix thermosphacta]|uniref:Glycosyl transferase family 1 domain-containing protein n=1 Tax=Brochothrix thermosphacta TaxID=2756 RepID=A0A2X0S7Q0_BROTH|nr:CDP-glycerol glycerophosphotransferase family protein [Brochothrix thermosphacta]SPP28692.1 conserved hypothetical protein [Brochothrix thermosphacta]
MSDKVIGIIGYNLFASGGTSRSNKNLIKEFLNGGHEVVFFNNEPFNNIDSTRLSIEEDILDRKISFKEISEINCDFRITTFIITRESMFVYAKSIRYIFPNSIIVGEIHAPLALIKETTDLSLDYIDCVRVSTPGIAREFELRYQFANVFSLNVSLNHISTKIEDVDSITNNLVVYSRFEDDVKDISYAIKLLHYVVNILKKYSITLYINGYGPSEKLYKKLIDYYSLQKNVYINKGLPDEYTYLSTSRFETFGYSIIESLSNGHKVISYNGEDNVIKDLYSNMSGIGWIDKDLTKDAHYIISFLEHSITEKDYRADMLLIRKLFSLEKYSEIYFEKVQDAILKARNESLKKGTLLPEEFKVINISDKIKKYKGLRKKITKLPYLAKIINHPSVLKAIKKIILKNSSLEYLNYNSYGKIRENYFFIESFHGANFTGDPKYLAIAIKKVKPESKIFISSKNQLVDIEVRNFGFEPIRTGSQDYLTLFNKCKTIIINGNTLDMLIKHPNQRVIQTWHGFPLKKMVNDIESKKERDRQARDFFPRMMKWDYLLTSSDINTELLRSAFRLEKNQKLIFFEEGLPKNQYLIKNKASSDEIEKLKLKYFFNKDIDKKYILYSPTWRRNNRKRVTQLNLKLLIEKLPLEYELIVKLHPNESHLCEMYRNMHHRIHCFYNELVDIQELFLLSNCFISDYSSAIFDYAHTDKKIIILHEDSNVYRKNIGFYFDLEKLTGLKGVKYNETSLVEAILKEEKGYLYNEIITSQLLSKDSLDTTVNLLSKFGIKNDMK